MRYLIVKAHDNRAAPVQGVEKQAVVPDIDIRTAQIAAGHGKLSDISESLQPVAQKHHRRAGGAALSSRALRTVAVEAVEHDISKNLRRNFLALKQKADRV